VPVANVAMILALLACLLPQPGGYRFPATLRWLTALVLWCVFSMTATSHPVEVSETTYQFVKIGAIALVAANVLRSRAQLNFFILFFLACYAFFPARAGLFNSILYGAGRTGWRGVYGNPNDLAAMTLLALGMNLGVFFSARNNVLRLLSLAGVGTLSLVVLLTQSRGAMIAMCVFGIAALVTTRGRERVRLLYALGLAAALGAAVAPRSTWERFAGLANLGTSTEDLKAVDPEGSAEQRFELWKVARRMIIEHPVTGVGWGAYGFEHRVYALRPEFKPTARGMRDTHSTLLNVAAEVGIPGVIIFAGVFVSAVAFAERIRRAARKLRPGDATMLLYLELGLLAYFVAGIFGSYAKLSLTYVHTMLLWAFAAMVARTLRQDAAGR
jgi:O-antigen ligase